MSKRFAIGPFALIFESEMTIKDFKQAIETKFQPAKGQPKLKKTDSAFDSLRQLRQYS